MPYYEYRCQDCRRRASIYQSYDEYGSQAVACPHCGGAHLMRVITRVRVLRSEDARLDSMSESSDWDGLDDDDPRAMARMMRKLGREMGEDLPDEFDEVIDRVEAGEDPDEIEKDYPELAGGGPGGDDLESF